MAKPITADRMLEILKAEGLTVKEVPGWRDRCRCCPDTVPHREDGPYARGWGDVVGTLTHITAGNLGKRTPLQYIQDIINGDRNTPVKAHFVPDPDGVVWINSVGRCNHAGKVGAQVKAHLRLADFRLDDKHDDRFDGASADGNAFTYGIENIAAVSMTAAQREASVRINAAIARELGWTGQESVGHGEVSAARVYADPNLDMGKFRRDVMARVKAGTKPTAPTPDPTPVEPDTRYVVKPGDTLGRIAKAKGLDLDALATWNGIADKDVIRVGQVLTLVAPEVIPPPCVVPEPVDPEPEPPTGVEWVDESLLFWNLAGYNAAKGKATALTRIPAIAAHINNVAPDVLVFVEASHAMLPALDKALPNYRRALRDGRGPKDANGAGRELYVRKAILDIEHVVFGNVDTMLNGDDKPMLGVVYRPKGGGSPRAVVAAHNENQDGVDKKTGLDADTIRVRQLREGLAFLVHDVAAPHKVTLSNQAYGADTNSYEWALDEANRMNWRSAFQLAADVENEQYATHTNWSDDYVEAGHFDVVLVRHNSTVVSAEQWLDADTSDHNPILVVRKVRP